MSAGHIACMGDIRAIYIHFYVEYLNGNNNFEK
jgi:hypothetical protein